MASNLRSEQLGSHQVELDPTVDSLSRFGSRVRALVWLALVGLGLAGLWARERARRVQRPA